MYTPRISLAGRCGFEIQLRFVSQCLLESISFGLFEKLRRAEDAPKERQEG